ncbi:putative C6 transcription factor [Aspergillus melleus]|uniref:putative C6 transcription factor n=1 Tax=Aspergillus melleus TaxID=138277 RepID=UPI001E8E2D1E|nr:uncharacterized protein LDX57_010356 [Aspergillus melleus]KAH8432729.1 hypothetical protein LDX57_010356 [Aspergillus melleus]
MSDAKRRLAPAPTGANAGPDSQQRRKNVGTACLACKARKLKCTGNSPCGNCVKHGLECTLNQAADKRRRGHMKRKIDLLEDKEDLLIGLVGIIRESGNRRTIPLLNLIRSNASLSELRHYIDHELPRADLARTPELVEVCNEVQRLQQNEARSVRRILDAKRLSDIPRFRVPAGPWTTVTEDDDFVSHLVSLWFTWCHPFCNWIDRSRFLRDMTAGSKAGAAYCSPFLVNIILADACAYSDYPEACAKAEDPTTRGSHFYDEAKRLLEKEEGRITLPTVQGLGVLWSCASMTGRDRQGWIYRSQLAYSVQELSHTYSVLAHKADEDTLRMARVISNTHWGLFNIATVHALFEKKMPPIKPPKRVSLPPVSHDSDQDDWQPYPTFAEGIQSHTDCLFNALCQLNLIAYDLCALFFRGDPEWSPVECDRRIEDAHTRLRQWSDRLPDCLKGSQIEAPHSLSLHMYYHAIIMILCGLSSTLPSSSPHSHDHLDPRPHPQCHNNHQEDSLNNPRLSSARTISQLLRIHRTSWGVDRMPVLNIHFIATALFALLDHLSDPANRDAFVDISITAKAFSRRWESSKTMLRSLRATSREREIELPTEADPLFAVLECQGQGPRLGHAPVLGNSQASQSAKLKGREDTVVSTEGGSSDLS